MIKSHLPLRVSLVRVGEPDLINYGAGRVSVSSAEAACQFWQNAITTQPGYEIEKEHLVALLLDTRLKPLGYHVVAVGSLNECVAHPREIFRAAILAGAFGFIVMHNHPSGDPAPSQADHRLTRKITEASRFLQVNLLDHVVIGSPSQGRQAYFSFRESGCL